MSKSPYLQKLEKRVLELDRIRELEKKVAKEKELVEIVSAVATIKDDWFPHQLLVSNLFELTVYVYFDLNPAPIPELNVFPLPDSTAVAIGVQIQGCADIYLVFEYAFLGSTVGTEVTYRDKIFRIIPTQIRVQKRGTPPFSQKDNKFYRSVDNEFKDDFELAIGRASLIGDEVYLYEKQPEPSAPPKTSEERFLESIKYFIEDYVDKIMWTPS